MGKQVDHVAEMFADGRAKLDKNGAEILDPRPMALPVGFERPESIQELIRRLVVDPQIREELLNSDAETFDEADDFDVPDDVQINTPYEEAFDPLHLATREQEVRLGAVKPLTPEQIAEAKALVEKHRKKPAAPAADAVSPSPSSK